MDADVVPYPTDWPRAPATGAREAEFHDTKALKAVRQMGVDMAETAGLPSDRVDALLLAISELATNSLEHGGGRGHVEMWTEGASVVCVVSDRGHILDPQAGRRPPGPMAPRGRGLWVVRQACNEVRQATTPEGTATRIVVGPEGRTQRS